eukprot:m.163114 g.163114  ORF g.163114 m.163114 type:complete len:448 (-) comp18096_c0_seq5:27-1370(-)
MDADDNSDTDDGLGATTNMGGSPSLMGSAQDIENTPICSPEAFAESSNVAQAQLPTASVLPIRQPIAPPQPKLVKSPSLFSDEPSQNQQVDSCTSSQRQFLFATCSKAIPKSQSHVAPDSLENLRLAQDTQPSIYAPAYSQHSTGSDVVQSSIPETPLQAQHPVCGISESVENKDLNRQNTIAPTSSHAKKISTVSQGSALKSTSITTHTTSLVANNCNAVYHRATAGDSQLSNSGAERTNLHCQKQVVGDSSSTETTTLGSCLKKSKLCSGAVQGEKVHKLDKSSRTTLSSGAAKQIRVQCKQCGKGFASKGGLTRHMRNAHRQHVVAEDTQTTSRSASSFPNQQGFEKIMPLSSQQCDPHGTAIVGVERPQKIPHLVGDKRNTSGTEIKNFVLPSIRLIHNLEFCGNTLLPIGWFDDVSLLPPSWFEASKDVWNGRIRHTNVSQS